MTNYPQHASLHRAALLMGLTNGASVIAWADEAISGTPDVGTTGDVAAVETRVRLRLNQFAGGESAFLEAYP